MTKFSLRYGGRHGRLLDMRVRLPCFGFLLLVAPLGESGCKTTSGGQSGDEGNQRAEPASVTGSPTLTPGCIHTESYGPLGPHRRSYSCRSTDERYYNGELRWSGPETPAGPYTCSCLDGPRDVAEAESCLDAMVSACAVDLNVPEACTDAVRPFPGHWQDVSICWPVFGAPGSWSCQCAPDDPLTLLDGETCRSALDTACSLTCVGDAGLCEPTYPDAGQLVVP